MWELSSIVIFAVIFVFFLLNDPALKTANKLAKIQVPFSFDLGLHLG